MITRTYHQNQKEKKKKKAKHINKWKHSDLPFIDDFKWSLPILALDSHEPLLSFFEKFICNEFVRFDQNKGNHSYKLELHDLKAFIEILLISRYVDLPQCPMLWECSVDVHNDAFSSMMSRNKFDEIMKHNLANNTSLDPNDKFIKV